MKYLANALVLPLLACAAPQAGAQLLPNLPVSVELRLGAALPTGDLAEAEPGIGAETGPAFGAAALFHFSGVLSAYGGYSRTLFSCPPCGESGIDDRVVDAGAEFGVQAMLPARIAGASPWLRAGGVYGQLTFSGQGGRLSSEPTLGYEVGGGISVGVTRSLAITPGLRFRAYPAEFDLGKFPRRTVDASRILADVGLAYRF